MGARGLQESTIKKCEEAEKRIADGTPKGRALQEQGLNWAQFSKYQNQGKASLPKKVKKQVLEFEVPTQKDTVAIIVVPTSSLQSVIGALW